MVSSRIPSVYIPIEPEDNGLGIPMVLSILVHGLIIGFVFFTHRVPDINIPPSIETSIVTPEELAAIQAGIQANREAGQSGTQGDVASESFDAAMSTNDSNGSTRSNNTIAPPAATKSTQVTRRSVPIFIPSDDMPLDDFDPDSQVQTQVDTRTDANDIKTKSYEERMQIFREQSEQESKQTLQEFAEQVAQQKLEEKGRVAELKTKRPNTEKPIRIAKTFPAADSGSNSNDNAGNSTGTLSLGDDGNPIFKGSGTGSGRNSSGASGGKKGGSSGSNHSAIESRIMSKFIAPVNTANQRTVLRVKVAADGTVLEASANGGTSSLEKAAVAAAYAASPLPIDSSDSSTYPVFTMGVLGK